VPVPAVAGCKPGHDDFVTLTNSDLVIATGAAILLDGLVRLHVPHVYIVEIAVHGGMYGTGP
jgi:hypothetical protein